MRRMRRRGDGHQTHAGVVHVGPGVRGEEKDEELEHEEDGAQIGEVVPAQRKLSTHQERAVTHQWLSDLPMP